MVVKVKKKAKVKRRERSYHVSSQQSITDMLAEAIRYHQSGNLVNAGSLYKKILKDDPEHADALHLLGVISYQTDNNQRAVEYIERAITKNPSASFYHNNLGNALMNLNELDKAIQCFKEALRLNPDNVEACNNLGNAFRKMGSREKALEHYTKAIDIKPDYIGAINNLANLLKEQGKIEEAITHYRMAIKLKPDLAEAYYNLGTALEEAERFDESVEQYSKAISMNPQLADAYNNLGNVLKKKKMTEAAARKYKKAVLLRRDFAEAYNNLGDVYRMLGRLDEAVEQCQKAIRIKSSDERFYLNFGNTLLDQGKYQEAMEQYEKAINMKPDFAEAHYSRGMVLLTQGRLGEGWKEYEWRLRSKEISKDIGYKLSKTPEWDGSPLDGKTILIVSEQGVGDHIQFARYIPLVKERGGRVVFESRYNLIRLFEGYEGIDILLEESPNIESDTNPDVRIQLLSLPLLFATKLDTIFADVPYLKVDAETSGKWKSRIDSNLFKVGLVWSGNSYHKNDHNRSCNLSDFAPLTDIPGSTFYSLQKGGMRENKEELPNGMHIVDIGKDLHDFYDTAAAIENLDLVISVDTAVVHLAGALGKPVWTLLPFVPDWRWMLDSNNTPWYPTMRLFRQPILRDWTSVMKQVSLELEKEVLLKGAPNE
jgi:tetratricopeptide (TPR) repeat protein